MDGTITTVAGGGTETGDPPATSVKLSNPASIAFILYGELLVAEYQKVVRKMDSSGFLRVIAGGGTEVPPPNNPIPAKTASIKTTIIAYARDGSDSIFIGDYSGFIYQVTSPRMCYGVEFDKAAVCSRQGSCIAIDQCACNDGWAGHDCSVTLCFGVMSNVPYFSLQLKPQNSWCFIQSSFYGFVKDQSIAVVTGVTRVQIDTVVGLDKTLLPHHQDFR